LIVSVLKARKAHYRKSVAEVSSPGGNLIYAHNEEMAKAVTGLFGT
jgi:hypothetical protein